MMSAAPPVTLRERLADAREREEPFEHAWPTALAAASRGQPRAERDAWSTVFSGTANAWRGAFERSDPPSLDVALASLGAEIAEAMAA